jgi:predicted ArsR family transcriptional regulator
MIGAVSALHDPTRRALYDLVRRGQPIGRDDVAIAAQLPRSTVAFHLDRMVAVGLLDVARERRSGRSGPGAGRPAKLYSITDRELAVTVPERHYELMADLLASAVEQATGGETGRAALQRVAEAQGRAVDADGAPLAAVLAEHGYEPVVDGDDLVLRNCPFRMLAAKHAPLVCEANEAFLSGVAEATGGDPSKVVRAPSAGHCCVRIVGAAEMGGLG